MKKEHGKKLFLNKTTVASLSREAMKHIAGGSEGCDNGAEEPISEEDSFLSIVTCKAENGSHCKRCDSCCVGTLCSR